MEKTLILQTALQTLNFLQLLADVDLGLLNLYEHEKTIHCLRSLYHYCF